MADTSSEHLAVPLARPARNSAPATKAASRQLVINAGAVTTEHRAQSTLQGGPGSTRSYSQVASAPHAFFLERAAPKLQPEGPSVLATAPTPKSPGAALVQILVAAVRAIVESAPAIAALPEVKTLLDTLPTLSNCDLTPIGTHSTQTQHCQPTH